MTSYDHFFLVICTNIFEFGELTNFFGHMPISGRIWLQVASLKNIEKYWKRMEKLHRSSDYPRMRFT
jgi:hypothetical protein